VVTSPIAARLLSVVPTILATLATGSLLATHATRPGYCKNHQKKWNTSHD
jgi:hypothetical protein